MTRPSCPGSARTRQSAGTGIDDQIDMLAHQTPQHPLKLGDQVATSSSFGCSTCRRLKASSCWVREAPLSAAARIALSAWRSSAASANTQQHVAVPHDDGQQIIEIVGDSARQSPHGLHFLRLAKLFLAATQGVLHGLCAR